MAKRLYSSVDFGRQFRAERKALGRTQEWVAKAVGCQRKAIIDLEAGRNVEMRTVFAALSALDKALMIVSSRPEAGEPWDFWDESVEDQTPDR